MAYSERTGIMLANPVTPRRLLKIAHEGKVFSQRKLNGERCRTIWLNDEPYFVSSYGNEFSFLTRIRNDIISFHMKTGIEPVNYDGEIYKHGWSRERIDSALRRKKNYNPDVEELEYHIFDTTEPVSQWNRASKLMQLRDLGLTENSSIKHIPVEVITIDEWENKTLEYITDGYEGIIIRAVFADYQEKRTPFMLKFKPSGKDDYLIIDVTEGKGWCEGMLGAFQVKGNDATVFNVGTGPELTKEKRIYYWSIRNKLIGKFLTVKHGTEKTSGGIFNCTVAYKVNL